MLAANGVSTAEIRTRVIRAGSIFAVIARFLFLLGAWSAWKKLQRDRRKEMEETRKMLEEIPGRLTAEEKKKIEAEEYRQWIRTQYRSEAL